MAALERKMGMAYIKLLNKKYKVEIKKKGYPRITKRIIRGTPVELDKNIDQILAEPVKPDLIKRRDPDLDRGIASLFKEKF